MARGVKTQLMDESRVIYQAINYNNVGVVTKDVKRELLAVYILDGASGKVLFNSVIKEADLDKPVNLVGDTNSYMISYFNKVSRIYEIWNIEMFLRRVDDSAPDLLFQYYTGGLDSLMDNQLVIQE